MEEHGKHVKIINSDFRHGQTICNVFIDPSSRQVTQNAKFNKFGDSSLQIMQNANLTSNNFDCAMIFNCR